MRRWYVATTYSGFENSISGSKRKQIVFLGKNDFNTFDKSQRKFAYSIVWESGVINVSLMQETSCESKASSNIASSVHLNNNSGASGI